MPNVELFRSNMLLLNPQLPEVVPRPTSKARLVKHPPLLEHQLQLQLLLPHAHPLRQLAPSEANLNLTSRFPSLLLIVTLKEWAIPTIM